MAAPLSLPKIEISSSSDVKTGIGELPAEMMGDSMSMGSISSNNSDPELDLDVLGEIPRTKDGQLLDQLTTATGNSMNLETSMLRASTIQSYEAPELPESDRATPSKLPQLPSRQALKAGSSKVVAAKQAEAITVGIFKICKAINLRLFNLPFKRFLRLIILG